MPPVYFNLPAAENAIVVWLLYVEVAVRVRCACPCLFVFLLSCQHTLVRDYPRSKIVCKLKFCQKSSEW